MHLCTLILRIDYIFWSEISFWSFAPFRCISPTARLPFLPPLVSHPTLYEFPCALSLSLFDCVSTWLLHNYPHSFNPSPSLQNFPSPPCARFLISPLHPCLPPSYPLPRSPYANGPEGIKLFFFLKFLVNRCREVWGWWYFFLLVLFLLLIMNLRDPPPNEIRIIQNHMVCNSKPRLAGKIFHSGNCRLTVLHVLRYSFASIYHPLLCVILEARSLTLSWTTGLQHIFTRNLVSLYLFVVINIVYVLITCRPNLIFVFIV